MKRKLLFYMMAVLLCYNAQAVVVVDGISYNLSGTEAEVTSNDLAYSGEITIPSSFTYNDINYQVTSIAERAFYGCTEVTSINIPESVTHIGSNAFGATAWYKSQSDGLVYAGKVAYKWKGTMTGFPSIELRNDTKGIADYAFDGLSLVSITLPDCMETIGKGAFRSCSALGYSTSITIPNSVTSIGDYAFYDSGITSIILPDGLVNINKGVFENCQDLSSVTIPISVTTINQYAFHDCDALTSITIPSSVTTIGERAFSACDALTSITIPGGVTSMGEGAFGDCATLSSVNISEGVTIIGGQAFVDCVMLSSVNIPNSVTTINDGAFLRCSNLLSITIPNNVSSIGSDAFTGCSSLTAITIPSSVTAIGSYVFSGCSSLTSVTVDAGNPVYDSRENCNAIIETSSNILIIGCQSTIIPNSVTAIGDDAFRYCYSLTAISIPSSVTAIGNRAFLDCSSLTSVAFVDNMPTISNSSFSGIGSSSSPASLIVPFEYTSNFENAFDGSGKFYNGYFTLYQTPINVTLAPAGYATYYNEKVAVRLPAELSAKGVADIEDGRLSYATIADAGGIVPLGTAIILCGPETENATTYSLSLVTNNNTYAGPNLLRGSDAATTTTGGEVYYKLTYGSASGHEDVFGWYWGEEDGAAFSIGAHKAWLAITREQAGLDGGTPVKSFGLPGNVTDGLPNMEGFGQTKQLSEPYYHDLQGRRVSRPASGLYIVNGKKIAIM